MSVPTLTLLELNKSIRLTLEEKFDAPIWIIAEINNINIHRSGHCYLELVQKAKDSDKIVAQARATIWATQFRFISSYFQSVTNKSLERGINVLVKVSVDFHEQYGISLNIRDIDPNYTLGDLERRKKEIIEKLISEGIFDMNKSLTLPTVIQRLAVISSAGAAGYEDFINQISSNKYDYSFAVTLFEADMQGANTETSVVNALNNIFDRQADFDVVVIIRGGGSKSDLSYFDNYNIAFHVTQIPLPVLSGIGHERDESVTDMVAHTKLKTPTAVANFIVDYNSLFENELLSNFDEITANVRDILKTGEMYLAAMSLSIYKTKDILSKSTEKCNSFYYRLKNISQNKLKGENIRLENSKLRIVKLPSVLVATQNQELNRKIVNLTRLKNYYFSNQEMMLKNLEQRIRLTDPENVLRRGFSITKIAGKTVSSKTKINIDDEIETIIYKNKITSKVLKNENSE
jgi:exodeoxyribonuclease VII large subunit